MSNRGELDYAKPIKKAHEPAKDVDADWDGLSSDWFAIGADAPIKGLLLGNLAAGDITFQVSDTSAGTTVYELSVAEDLTAKSGNVALFVPELAPFDFARVTSTGSQTNATIKLVRTA